MKLNKSWTKRLAVFLCAVMTAAGISAPVLAAEALNPIIEQDLAALTADSLLTVPAMPGDQADLLLDNLVLPSQGQGGSVITWESSHSAVSREGLVTRGGERAEATLRATAEYEGETGSKEFHFVVPAQSEIVNGMPVLSEMKQTSDFSNGQISLSDGSAVTLTQKGGTAASANGKLELRRTVDDASECSAVFHYPNSNLTGNFVTEFLLSRDTGQAGRINMWGSAQHFQIDWAADGAIQAYFSDTQGGQGTAYTLPPRNYESSDRIKLTLFVCGDRGTVSLWINNRAAFLDRYPFKPSSGGMTANCITAYNIKSGLGSVYIEDYRCYTANFVQTQEMVDADLGALSEESLMVIPPFEDGSIIDDLDLPLLGEHGSFISWSSDHPGVISNTGKVNQGESRTAVTMTATIGTGDISRTKELFFTVPAQGEDLGLPSMAELKCENEFDSSIPSSILKLTYGAGWTVQEHGKLRLIRKDSSNSNPNAYYSYSAGNLNIEPAHGTFVTEFTVTKEDVSQRFKAAMWGASSGSPCSIEWQEAGSGGEVIAGYIDGKWMKLGTAADFGMRDHTLKFAILFNESRQNFSLWINNKLALRNKGLYNKTNGAQVNGITFYNGEGNSKPVNNAPGTVTIDHYRYYTSVQDGDYDWTDDSFAVTGEGAGQQVTFKGSGLYFGEGSPAAGATVILALKTSPESGGIMTGYAMQSYDFASSDPLELSCPRNGAAYAELYLWDGVSGLKPLANPKTIPLP